jgi:hypothetical protein
MDTPRLVQYDSPSPNTCTCDHSSPDTLRDMTDDFPKGDDPPHCQESPERRLLGPFVDCIDDFRLMMRRYSAIIAGSTVLHLFSPSEDWTPNDLDIFVSWDSLASYGLYDLHVFLVKTCGYILQDSHDINQNFPSARSFVYAKGKRVIELHCTVQNPISLVIDFFPLSNLKNYATADKAYCLFPQLTLREQNMTAFRCTTAQQLSAIYKYRDRGFRFISFEDAKSYEEVDSIRSTEDSLCETKSFSYTTSSGSRPVRKFDFLLIEGKVNTF